MRMTTEELVIRQLIGPGRGDTEALCLAMEAAQQLLFTEQRHSCMSDIRVSREIYSSVAQRLGTKEKSAARQIQRTAKKCWDSMDEEQRLRYIGKRELPEVTPDTRDIIFYLAFYCHYGKPYYQVLKREIGR